MMIDTTPSVAEIDATMNLLSVLELAKDATKLKGALQEVKAAQDAASAERKAADASIAQAKQQAAELERQAGLVEQDRAKVKEESTRVFKAAEEVDLTREAMRDDRNKFDRWMADQREGLAASQAKVESDRVANARRAEDLKAIEDSADRRVKEADAAIKAADAKRAEFEAKLAGLKAMVS
jgi:chromosome segregation ATPase